ncbi:MAG: efflux RND transporter permease subunit [Calditrichia bacterium]
MTKKSFDPKKSFFYFTTQRPVAITMIVLGIMVFGYLSYNQLSLTLMPDISYPSLTVRTEYPGAAPEEVENAISRPIEEALSVVSDLVNISSISKEGQSDVIMEFDWDADINEAISEVREKLDMVFLPSDAEKPLILRYDPSLDPIIRMSLTGAYPLVFLRYVADEDLKRELEGIPGVASVKVKGGYEEEIHVELDEERIAVMGLDIQQIKNRLAQENINLAGGKLKEGETEFIVRTMNEFKTVDEIKEITIGFSNDRLLKLGDIANVVRATKEREVITRVDGLESVELEIYKEADANIVEVARTVLDKVFGTPEQQAFVAQMKEKKEGKSGQKQDPRSAFRQKLLEKQMTNFVANTLPEGMKLSLLSDQSVFIKNSIDEVKNTAMLGGLLAIIVLLLFLRDIRTTVIIGISIPLSIIVTFAPMRMFDVTLNIMSLGGLALGIGMLVDNSIVVLESIFRCREEGDDLITSVVRGVSEVGTAVSASTLTTIAVFFPMVFVKGIAGQIFGDLALTVVFSLLASLLVAIFVIPMMASRQFGGMTTSEGGTSFQKEKIFKPLASIAYLRELKQMLFFSKDIPLIKKVGKAIYGILYALVRFILDVISLVFTLIFAGIAFLTTLFLGLIVKFLTVVFNNFLGKAFGKLLEGITGWYESVLKRALQKRGLVVVVSFGLLVLATVVIFPALGSELIPEVHQGEFYVDLTFPIGTPVETTTALTEPIEKYIASLPVVEKVSTTAGTDKTMLSRTETGEHTARITVKLKPTDNVEHVEEEAIATIRQYLRDFPGLENKISRPVLFSFKTPVEVIIKGYNLQSLLAVSKEATSRLSEIPGLYDVKTNLQSGNPEVQITYDRVKMAFYNLNIETIASIVRDKVLGDVATEFKEEDRRIDVRVRVKEEDRETLQQLRRLNVNPSSNRPVPLEAVANIEIKEGPSEIRRINQERAIQITANISGRSLSEVSQDIYGVLQQMNLPVDFTYEIAGQNKEMEVSLNSLKLALLLAIFLVYIVMASQFESFLHPFIILFTVPLAVIGVILVLWILSIPISVVVFLGAIMLAGIVVNNAIVLVDYINHLRSRGMDLIEAVQTAGKVRLRPILMTTMTTVLGLLPMAIGLGDGAEIRTPMAITVIAGLISSTVLTLIIIPCVYTIAEEVVHARKTRQELMTPELENE